MVEEAADISRNPIYKKALRIIAQINNLPVDIRVEILNELLTRIKIVMDLAETSLSPESVSTDDNSAENSKQNEVTNDQERCEIDYSSTRETSCRSYLVLNFLSRNAQNHPIGINALSSLLEKAGLPMASRSALRTKLNQMKSNKGLLKWDHPDAIKLTGAGQQEMLRLGGSITPAVRSKLEELTIQEIDKLREN